MASLYTCRACSRALLTQSSRQIPISSTICLSSQAQRSFATKPPASKKAPAKTTPVKVPSKGAPAGISAGASAKAGGVTGNAKPGQQTQYPSTKTMSQSIASKLREKAPLFTETYVAYGACAQLVKECVRPGDYTIPQALEKKGEIPTDENGTHIGVGEGWWYQTLGLKPTFLNWSQITFIHMWMLQVRFRMLPATHAPIWIEHMTNHAFYAAEDRLAVWHKYTANSLRQKAMKDMFSQWRAVLLSYDEALVKGDAMLAAAVWRNLLGGREDVDFDHLAQIVGYMMRELRRLDQASDEVVVNGSWKFVGDPGEEKELVKRSSPLAQASAGVKK